MTSRSCELDTLHRLGRGGSIRLSVKSRILYAEENAYVTCSHRDRYYIFHINGLDSIVDGMNPSREAVSAWLNTGRPFISCAKLSAKCVNRPKTKALLQSHDKRLDDMSMPSLISSGYFQSNCVVHDHFLQLFSTNSRGNACYAGYHFLGHHGGLKVKSSIFPPPYLL